MFKTLFIALFLVVPCKILADSPKLFHNPVTGRLSAVAIDTSHIKKIKSATARSSINATNESYEIAENFISKYGSLFGLHDAKMQLLRVEGDELGFTHIRYQQYLKDLPVFGARLSVHLSPGNNSLLASGGISVENYTTQGVLINSDTAKEKVSTMWQETFGGLPKITLEPELIWLDRTSIERNSSTPLRKAWMVVARSFVPFRIYRIFIDAENGELLLKLSLVYGDINRLIFDCAPGGGSCYLDDYDGGYLYTFGRSEGQPVRGANPAVSSYKFDTDNLYTYMDDIHSYFFERHGRNGANNLAGVGDGFDYPSEFTTVYSYADVFNSLDTYNAAWGGGFMVFGSGMATLDIAAHEYSHAVDDFSADLIYLNENGALKESFADIFGEAAEYYVNGSNDWLIGTDSVIGALRNMADPTSIPVSPVFGVIDPQPDKIHSNYFYCGSFDLGGVHQNSGVLNHAAYLIAIGGTFNGCTITGLGREAEERIFYRTLTHYLTPTSGFNDAYLAINNACKDLYSAENCLEVKKALNAVELNQVSKCLGGQETDPGCSAIIDECPDTPNQVSVGACGCAVAEVDNNLNDVADCIDPVVVGVTPVKPTLKLANGVVKVRVAPKTGVYYSIKVINTIPASNGKKAKRTTKYYTTTSTSYRTKKFIPGSMVEIAYAYVLDGTPLTYSNYSPKKKITVN